VAEIDGKRAIPKGGDVVGAVVAVIAKLLSNAARYTNVAPNEGAVSIQSH
jgi:hypothetical protein